MSPFELSFARKAPTWRPLPYLWQVQSTTIRSLHPLHTHSESPAPTDSSRPTRRPPHLRQLFRRVGPPVRTSFDPRIHPESLDETLSAHRASHHPDPAKQAASEARRTRVRREMDAAARGRPTPPNHWQMHRVPKKVYGIDYEAQVLSPREEWELSPDQAQPESLVRPWLAWRDPRIVKTGDQFERLTDEIHAFAKYMELTASEASGVEVAVKEVRDIVIATEGGVMDVELIGSRSTGLAMPLSDLDVNIRFERHQKARRMSRLQAMPELSRLSKKIREVAPRGVFERTHYIAARTPLVTTLHRKTGLKIQLQSTLDSFASRDMVRAYMSEFPTLKALFLVLRQTLLMRGLGDGSHQGLSSYPLTMLIVATLKFSGARFHPADTARQLLYCLDFIDALDTENIGISLEPLQLFKKKGRGSHGMPGVIDSETARTLVQDEMVDATQEMDAAMLGARKRLSSQSGPKRAYLLCLQDPANLTNDLGLRTLAIKHIRATLGALKRGLKEKMDAFGGEIDVNDGFSLLDPFLKGNYAAFISGRNQLSRVGNVGGEIAPVRLLAGKSVRKVTTRVRLEGVPPLGLPI